MHAIEMSFQSIFLITGIGTYATTIGLFSRVDSHVDSKHASLIARVVAL